MIASRLPAFAKLGPKLDRAGRELANLDAFLAGYDALPPEQRTTWGAAHGDRGRPSQR